MRSRCEPAILLLTSLINSAYCEPSNSDRAIATPGDPMQPAYSLQKLASKLTSAKKHSSLAFYL
jgi:hypothetical protein